MVVNHRLQIDYAKCQGHARCISLVPSLFSSDDYGNGQVRQAALLTIEDVEKARVAQRNCPEFAIMIRRAEAENGD